MLIPTLLFALGLNAAPDPTEPPSPPNIVIIHTVDQGWFDLGDRLTEREGTGRREPGRIPQEESDP